MEKSCARVGRVLVDPPDDSRIAQGGLVIFRCRKVDRAPDSRAEEEQHAVFVDDP